MTSAEQEIFFELLRASIWQREVNLKVFQTPFSWSNICRSLESHALLALAADAILNINEKLPSDCQLTQMQVMAIMQHSATIAQKHYELNNAVIELFKSLSDITNKYNQKMHPILLKGQGLATLYPIRNTRSCGDIDVYVGRDFYELAKEFIKSKCTIEEISEVDEDCHQYHITHNGITYEIHPIAGLSAVASKQVTYERWSDQYLTVAKCEQVDILSSREVNTLGLTTFKITVPNLQFNLVYVFDHLCRHLRFEGVGIRQFVDFAILISQIKKNPSKNFDLCALKQDLKALGLYRAWRVLGSFVVEYLGIPAEEYPFYLKKSKLPDRILELLIEGGTFDSELNWRKHTKHDASGVKRILTALKNDLQVARTLYPLFPRQAVEGFLCLATRSLREKFRKP